MDKNKTPSDPPQKIKKPPTDPGKSIGGNKAQTFGNLPLPVGQAGVLQQTDVSLSV